MAFLLGEDTVAPPFQPTQPILAISVRRRFPRKQSRLVRPDPSGGVAGRHPDRRPGDRLAAVGHDQAVNGRTGKKPDEDPVDLPTLRHGERRRCGLPVGKVSRDGDQLDARGHTTEREPAFLVGPRGRGPEIRAGAGRRPGESEGDPGVLDKLSIRGENPAEYAAAARLRLPGAGNDGFLVLGPARGVGEVMRHRFRRQRGGTGSFITLEDEHRGAGRQEDHRSDQQSRVRLRGRCGHETRGAHTTDRATRCDRGRQARARALRELREQQDGEGPGAEDPAQPAETPVDSHLGRALRSALGPSDLRHGHPRVVSEDDGVPKPGAELSKSAVQGRAVAHGSR